MRDDFTPYQQKVIKRFYDNRETLALQRLGELVTELFLADGKKRERVWKQAAAAMKNLGVPASRSDHILKQDDPKLLAALLKEYQ